METFRKRQAIRPVTQTFVSALSGREASYELNARLGARSATVYLTSDRRHVVKVYVPKPWRPQRYRMELHEVLISTFLKEHRLSVPEVVDYSANVIDQDGGPMYVVKRYAVGLSCGERQILGIPTDASFDRAKKRFEVPMQGFAAWIDRHPYGVMYLDSFARDGGAIGDLDESNWLLGPASWIWNDP